MIDKIKYLQKRSNTSDFSASQISNYFDDSKIEYLWSKDPDLLKQYSKIIADNYSNEINLKDVYKTIDRNDLRSFFRIGKIRNEVIAGVRVTINDPYTDASLPSEREYYKYSELYPELDLKNNGYCEITRFTVKPDYRGNLNHYKDFFKELAPLLDSLMIKYVFIWSSAARNRVYKIFASKYFDLVKNGKDKPKLD